MPSICPAPGHQKGKEKKSGLTHPQIKASLQASTLPPGLLAVPSPTKRAPRTPRLLHRIVPPAISFAINCRHLSNVCCALGLICIRLPSLLNYPVRYVSDRETEEVQEGVDPQPGRG